MAEFNDSFVQLNRTLMDENRNDEVHEIFKQCNSLSANIVSSDIDKVEALCNNTYLFEESGGICIPGSDKLIEQLRDSNEVVNNSDSGIHDSENEAILDAENFKSDISSIPANVTTVAVATESVIVSNGGLAASAENVSNAFISNTDVDTSKESTSVDDENMNLIDISGIDLTVPRSALSTDDMFVSNGGTVAAPDENVSNVYLSSENTDVSNAFISNTDVGASKESTSADVQNLNLIDISGIDENVPRSALSTGDVFVSNGGSVAAADENDSNVYLSSENTDVSNAFISNTDVGASKESTSADAENLNFINISGTDVNVPRSALSSGDVYVSNGGTVTAADENVSNMYISNGNTDACNKGEMMFCDFSDEINDVQIKDEEFHDAVQFFKDPSSLTFLETVGASNTEPESLTRSSVYMNFDPLHARFNSQAVKNLSEVGKIFEAHALPGVSENCSDSVKNSQTVKNLSELGKIIKADALPGVSENCSDSVENKHLANVSPQESRSNILISFDSPIKGNCVEPKANFSGEPPKLYTETELLQILKDQELNLQEMCLKKQLELELERTRKLEELEDKNKQQNILCTTLRNILKEIIDVACSLSDEKKTLQSSLDNMEKENSKLQEDLKTSIEDCQSVEHTFADFHKRYEQCKGMLKVYTQNEEIMKQKLENLSIQLEEKDEMYGALQTRTEEIVDKANMEVANAKRACDAQVAVLKVQLKKSELKVSSVENELQHLKIENSKLTNMCDELMAKVSEG